jgi:hypothetical protein
MFQIVDFSSVNDLKFTYVHLQFQKFFPGVIPRTPMVKGREGQGKGGEGKGGEAKEGRGGKGKEGREGREGGRGWGEPPPEDKSWLRPCLLFSCEIFITNLMQC